MDSITRIKEFIKSNFPDWEKISFSEFQENIDFRDDLSELYKINHEEIINDYPHVVRLYVLDLKSVL